MDKNKILQAQQLRAEGKSFGEIAIEMLITKSQAAYLCKLNAKECEEKYKHRQDFEEKICHLAKRCGSINEICKILNYRATNQRYKQIRNILTKYSIDTSHFGETENEYNQDFQKCSILEKLARGSQITSSKIRDQLISEGLKEHRCERCKNTEWEGFPIPLQLHHIDGNHENNSFENLQLLCPNCHSLTDTFCRKKTKKEVRGCAICGKEITKGATYCEDCYQNIVRKEKNKVTVPQKDDLLTDFKEFGSFRRIGKKYGVSDKTICKWFENYGLPSSSLEMRRVIINDYGKLNWKFNNGNPKTLENYNKQRYKQKCLLKEDGGVEKIYHSNQEIVDDGFTVKGVYYSCSNNGAKHKGRRFSFLE